MDTASRSTSGIGASVDSTKVLDVAFLEVDVSSEGTSACGVCDNANARTRLRAALGTVEPALQELGVEARIRQVLVRTEDEARALKLRASPTIRVGRVDLVPEPPVPKGGEGAEDGENRAWVWRGGEHALPPKAMILDAIFGRTSRSAVRFETRTTATDPSSGTGVRKRRHTPTVSPTACGCG